MKKPQHGAIAPDFYNEKYWYGETAVEGGYQGCNWEGWGYLVDAILDVFPTTNSLLDAGCGLGSLLQEAGKRELAVSGFDYSEYCYENPVGGGMYHHDILDPVRDCLTNHDVVCCFSVLEHLPFDYLSIAMKNLGMMAKGGILLVQVDLLDKSWESAKDLDPRTFKFDAERDSDGSEIAEALIASGHQTILPYNHWVSLFENHLGIKRRQDLENAIFNRCGHRMKWDNFMCFTNQEIPLRRTTWAIDRPNLIDENRFYERIHHGDTIGLSGYDNVRDQWNNWRERGLPHPEFIIHADKINLISETMQGDDWFFVTNHASCIPAPWVTISSEHFCSTRPRPYY